MRLTFVGHACFLVEADTGLRILIDPYEPHGFGGRFALEPFEEEVDIVAITHDHADHSYRSPAFGRPEVVRGSANARGVDFQGFALPHDDRDGRVRGMVTGLRFAVDGVAIFHPGDLGRPLTQSEAAAIRPVDILLLPTGGTFTIGPSEALEVMQSLEPAIAIPMHHAHPKILFPLAPLSDFLALVPRYERRGTGPLRVDRSHLPAPTSVVVLDPIR